MFEDLVTQHGLGSSGGRELIVLYGVSAAGLSALYNVEKIAGYLKAQVSASHLEPR